MQAISYKNKNFNKLEPFTGLFTQGMVCHETYKDKEDKWLSPDEVNSDDGKSFYNKKNPKEKITVGSSESMSKSKKILLIQKILFQIMAQMQLECLFYLIVHLKKIYNGQIKECLLHTSLFKNFGFCIKK